MQRIRPYLLYLEDHTLSTAFRMQQVGLNWPFSLCSGKVWQLHQCFHLNSLLQKKMFFSGSSPLFLRNTVKNTPLYTALLCDGESLVYWLEKPFGPAPSRIHTWLQLICCRPTTMKHFPPWSFSFSRKESQVQNGQQPLKLLLHLQIIMWFYCCRSVCLEF